MNTIVLVAQNDQTTASTNVVYGLTGLNALLAAGRAFSNDVNNPHNEQQEAV